ncbi:S-layer homology domain-containing protein [Bacillus sp. B190/17]|uniref:S-layer homology domain-containing protein n=1 Tax=Bacillus lumedeiriae TaxID=3058829 RepID=A0ABW8ICA5_9BACI
MNKWLMFIISCIFIGTVFSPAKVNAAARVFDDVSPKHRAYEAVWSLASKGVFEKDEDGKVRPGKYVTRMEAAVMTARILGLKRETNHAGFRDVTVLNKNYNEVAALAERGILQGFTDRTMRPNDILTRAQMAKLIVDAFGYERKKQFTLPFKDVKVSHWSAPYIEALVRYKVTSGTSTTTFSPDQKLTRAELMMFLYRAHQAKAVDEYNDQELFNLISEVQHKASSIIYYYLYVNVSWEDSMDELKKTRPLFSTFKKELTPFAEGKMLERMEAYYKVTCIYCDWLVYDEVYDSGLPYDILERSSEKIKVTLRYPQGLEEPHAETWTLVKRNGQWKMSQLPDYMSADEEPFHLTIAEAEKYLISQYENTYRHEKYREYVQDIYYVETDRKGNYEFVVNTNMDDYYVSIDPATAITQEL